MTDRDHFAAAALTGMLSRGDLTDIPARAWKAADAMLRERGAACEKQQSQQAESNETPSPTRQCVPPAVQPSDEETRQRGDGLRDAGALTKHHAAGGPEQITSQPVAWVVVDVHGKAVAFAFGKKDAEWHARKGDVIWPLYRQAQPALTEDERDAMATAAFDAEARCHYERGNFLRAVLERLK